MSGENGTASSNSLVKTAQSSAAANFTNVGNAMCMSQNNKGNPSLIFSQPQKIKNHFKVGLMYDWTSISSG